MRAFIRELIKEAPYALTLMAVYGTVGFLVSVLFMLILLTPMYLIYGL